MVIMKIVWIDNLDPSSKHCFPIKALHMCITLLSQRYNSTWLKYNKYEYT